MFLGIPYPCANNNSLAMVSRCIEAIVQTSINIMISILICISVAGDMVTNNQHLTILSITESLESR